ncbi:MAG: phosphoribosyl-ATP diphosphatase, partial [Myxococcaceae bacterium]
RTLATGEMHFHSRTRGLWHKGATSGNTQKVVSLTADCDADALLARVLPSGPACHTGQASCFGEPACQSDALGELDATLRQRKEAPAEPKSYTQKLFADRNLRLKKLGEETVELVTALSDGDRGRIAEEAADLLYHLLVAARAADVSLEDIRHVLAKRANRNTVVSL